MLWLIETELATTGQSDHGERSPRRVLHFRTMNSLGIERRHDCRQVVAHQIKLVLIILVTRMTSHFRRRQRENQPPMAGVDLMKAEHILEKRAIGFRVFTVKNYVCAIDHKAPSLQTRFDAGILSRDLLCLFNVSVNEETCLHFPERVKSSSGTERSSQVDCNVSAT